MPSSQLTGLRWAGRPRPAPPARKVILHRPRTRRATPRNREITKKDNRVEWTHAVEGTARRPTMSAPLHRAAGSSAERGFRGDSATHDPWRADNPGRCMPRRIRPECVAKLPSGGGAGRGSPTHPRPVSCHEGITGRGWAGLSNRRRDNPETTNRHPFTRPRRCVLVYLHRCGAASWPAGHDSVQSRSSSHCAPASPYWRGHIVLVRRSSRHNRRGS